MSWNCGPGETNFETKRSGVLEESMAFRDCYGLSDLVHAINQINFHKVIFKAPLRLWLKQKYIKWR